MAAFAGLGVYSLVTADPFDGRGVTVTGEIVKVRSELVPSFEPDGALDAEWLNFPTVRFRTVAGTTVTVETPKGCTVDDDATPGMPLDVVYDGAEPTKACVTENMEKNRTAGVVYIVIGIVAGGFLIVGANFRG